MLSAKYAKVTTVILISMSVLQKLPKSKASGFCTCSLLCAKTTAEGSSCFRDACQVRGVLAAPHTYLGAWLLHLQWFSLCNWAGTLWMCPDLGSGNEKVC